MMHHPNMHHQPMSGHPPQHLAAHQAMPAHHQIPPHQMHRESRHVTLARVPLGATQPGTGMGGHGQAMGGMGPAMGVPPPHHPATHRPPHPVRAMPHHPTAHHSMPPQQIKMRRPYTMGSAAGGYGPQAAGMMPPPYSQPPPLQPSPTAPPTHTVITSTSSHMVSNVMAAQESGGESIGPTSCASARVPTAVGGGTAENVAEGEVRAAVAGETEADRPPTAQANSKEKTPMCLVNELARYNKIKHQYRLTSEMGPAHKKVFTVTLRLGDTEEYTAEGSSIKRAQHAAAAAALAGTHFPPPPPRAPPAHAAHHPHHRHSGAVMPTVELNALAMKLCQPAIYTTIPPVAAVARVPRARAPPPPPYRMHAPFVPYPRTTGPALLYRVRVCVGGRAWTGEGSTPQAARHDAAARALRDLRLPPDTGVPGVSAQSQDNTENGDPNADLLNSEVKSPVSLVHELALKRNLPVVFSVKSERGPPHMRVFITTCTVGDMETDGEGNGKKVSKRRAAERMLEEMRRRWPPALLRTRTPHDKRRPQPAKKKPRNLIKEGGSVRGDSDNGADNPISRLAMARHAVRARSPQYSVLEERGAARRREFLVQCEAPPHSATGLGPNKKTAKRRAAHNVLMAMEMMNAENNASAGSAANDVSGNSITDVNKSNDIKRKEMDAVTGSGGATGEVRQPVPGVLLMDYHQRSGQPPPPNGVSENCATGCAGGGAAGAVSPGGAGGSSPGAKDQLMYLSQLIGFTVQFSDFPKRNHGEYLSLVSLSTDPPVMCHGGGPSTAHSHEQCSRAALRQLTLMGVDGSKQATAQTIPVTGAIQGVMSNGISE